MLKIAVLAPMRESQRQHSNRGEARGLSQRAEAVARVLPQIVQPRFPARLAHVILDGGQAAQLDARGAHGGIAAQACLQVALDGCVEIGAEFLIEFVLDPLAVEERADSAEYTADHAKHQISPSDARMMREIAAV